MHYVDGYVLSVPKNKLNIYKKMAKVAGKVWVRHGALSYTECVADDMKETGFCATFPQTFKPKKGEVMIFAYVTYKSRKHRDAVNKKVMKDPELHASCDAKNMPFDAKRMSYGGFKAMVHFE